MRLKGARIGVLTEFFGREPVHQDVNAVIEDAIRKMAEAGATMIRITIPALDRLTRNIQVAEYEAKMAFNNYLAALGPRAPVKTFDEFIARGEFHARSRQVSRPSRGSSTASTTPSTRTGCCAETICARRS